MTPAELKSFRQGLGLSSNVLAKHLNIQNERTIRHWEEGASSIPEGVARELEELDARIERCVAHNLRQINLRKESGPLPDENEVLLIRYWCDDDMKRYSPEELTELASSEIHGAMLERTRVQAARLGVRARIVYLYPAAYKTWRERHELNHSPAALGRWAALQAGPPNKWVVRTRPYFFNDARGQRHQTVRGVVESLTNGPPTSDFQGTEYSALVLDTERTTDRSECYRNLSQAVDWLSEKAPSGYTLCDGVDNVK
ncbi:MAG: DUF4447 family protein [Gammaproteobacteria bacterium]